MITVEDDDYLRISLLLLKGGGMVSEEILNREVNKSGKSIDKSLEIFKKKRAHELKRQFHRDQMDVLYPVSGEATNIKDWDIHLLTGVLLTVFEKGLDVAEMSAIDEIKYVRNNIYAHRSLKPLTHSEYQDVRKELEAALTFLSSKLDKAVQQKCKELIKECTETCLDAATVDTLLEGISGTEELAKEILNKLDRISNELKQNIDEQHEKSRKEIGENRILIDEILKILKDEKRSKQKISTVLDTELTLTGDNGEPEILDAAEKIIVTDINAAVDESAGRSENSQVTPAINDVIREINSIQDVEVLHAQPKCILLTFRCNSYEGLLKLLLYLESESYTKRLSKIVDAVCATLPLKKPIHLISKLNPKSLKGILNSIAIPAKSETLYSRTVALPIKVTSLGGMAKVYNLFENGGATNSFNKVSETISSHLGAKITLKPSLNVKQVEKELLRTNLQVTGETETHYHYDVKRNEETGDPRKEYKSGNDFKKKHENDYPNPKRRRHDENRKKDMYTEHEKSNDARQDIERPAYDSNVKTSFGSDETEEDISGNQFYKIDTQVWQRCVDSKDKQEADRLLNERILPNQALLDRVTDLFGVSSVTVKHICDSICLYMKENVREIVSVYPAIDCRHTSTRKHITFIIFTAQPSVININEYRCYPRCLHEKPSSLLDENMVIKEREVDCKKDWSEAEKIREILKKHSKSVMEHHTNITRISISWIKSKGYGTDNHTKEQKTCIAVNVFVKGLVPINEDVLPKTIDGIDVDVREGVVLSYGGGPNDYHEHLKMGCAIHGGLKNEMGLILAGTLGGFVEINGELFCTSCAHIFFSSHDMAKLRRNSGFCDLGYETRKCKVYQPVLGETQAFGNAVRAVFTEGGNGATGVDAVMIKVERRLPISGEFPECPHNRNTEVNHQSFSSGKMYNRDEVNILIRSKILTVVKFGCSTGWTRGVLRFDGGSVRLSHMAASYNNFGVLLYNQFEVECIGNTSFAENGDSGALVFADEDDQLSAIGIVEGGMSGMVFVTPIFEVFAALGLPEVQKMKEFSSMQNESKVSSNYLPSSSNSDVAPNPEKSLQKLNIKAFEQEIAQQIAKHTE